MPPVPPRFAVVKSPPTKRLLPMTARAYDAIIHTVAVALRQSAPGVGRGVELRHPIRPPRIYGADDGEVPADEQSCCHSPLPP